MHFFSNTSFPPKNYFSCFPRLWLNPKLCLSNPSQQYLWLLCHVSPCVNMQIQLQGKTLGPRKINKSPSPTFHPHGRCYIRSGKVTRHLLKSTVGKKTKYCDSTNCTIDTVHKVAANAAKMLKTSYKKEIGL